MKGLYTDAEMSSDNVKDKDSKIAFLQKLIDIVCKFVLFVREKITFVFVRPFQIFLFLSDSTWFENKKR